MFVEDLLKHGPLRGLGPEPPYRVAFVRSRGGPLKSGTRSPNQNGAPSVMLYVPSGPRATSKKIYRGL